MLEATELPACHRQAITGKDVVLANVVLQLLPRALREDPILHQRLDNIDNPRHISHSSRANPIVEVSTNQSPCPISRKNLLQKPPIAWSNEVGPTDALQEGLHRVAGKAVFV